MCDLAWADPEIKNLEGIVKEIQEKNSKLETEVMKALENIGTLVVKEASDTLVAIFSKKQDEFEERNVAKFDTLQEQLSIISKLLLPPELNQGSQLPEHPQVPPSDKLSKLQPRKQNLRRCEICAQTFETERSRKDHMKRYHKPVPSP